MNKKDDKKELLTRVKKAQDYLKHKKIKEAKVRFFDGYYGAMYKAESDRVTNLWARKITDVQFTERLEKFAEKPHITFKGDQIFERMFRFTEWYTKLGGTPLTREELEKIYPKFKL